MHYRSEIWVNQYQALINLHLANGNHMDDMEHVFGKELSVKWARLDYGRGNQNELMLYTFTNRETFESIKFKVSKSEIYECYDIVLLEVAERGIILCHGKEDTSINDILKKLLWPVTLAFDSIWFD